jgi:tRNA(Arg) A34 adenosine deaminase TadA
VQILLHARNVGDSDSFLEAHAEFSAMEEALRRNRNTNLHKFPVECVLKPFKTTLHSS